MTSPTERKTPSASELKKAIKLIRQLFIARDDIYAQQNDDGTYTAIKERVTDEVIEKHLKGEITIGAYTLSPKDDSVKWGCIDIDGEHIEDAAKKGEIIRKKLIAYGVHPESILTEESGSLDSFHLWVFLNLRIKAKKARDFLKAVRDEIDNEIEVFPKQDTAGIDSPGNLVKLPFGYHKKAKKWTKAVVITTKENVIEGLKALEVIKRSSIPIIKKEIKSDITGVRPCFKKAVDEKWQLEGSEGHSFRLALVNELIANNYTDEQIHEVFRLQNDYEEKTTQDNINYSRTNYGKPFRCETIREKSLSFVSELCKTCTWKREIRNEKEEEFDLLSEFENAINESKKIKYHGTINFNPDLGIFFTVPWAIPPLITKGEKGKIYVHTPIYKPIFFTPREGFARPTDKSKESEIKKYLPTQPKKIIEVISQFSEIIEGVPLYLNQKQQVQLLEAYLTLLKTGENTCKQINEDLVTHLYSKHISYFKYVKDIEHYVVGCWAIGTYLFPMFPVFPYLIFIGEKGTNKSGGLVFLDRVCWNSTSKLSLPNEAPLFRLMHQATPTQLIDEVHRQLNDPIRGPVFKALLETGHEKGGRVPRCNENDNNKIDFNDVYCPKALASRESLELEEKAITIIATKVQDKSYAIARKNLESDPELDNIQAGLLNFALTNWEKIYTTYQKIEPTPKLSGRYFMLWAPIIAICKTAYPDKYEEMVEYAEEAIMGAQKKSYEIELTVLSWLATRLNDIKNNGSAILLKDVKDSLNLKWQPTYSALRNLGVIKLDRDTKQGKKYYLRVDRIEKLAAERGITTEDDDTPEKEVCDKCGKDTLTSEYNGMQVCPECKEELMKTEPQKNLLPKNHEKTKRKESEEQKPTPKEIKKIILEVGKCKACGKEEADLYYVVHYSNDEFFKICDECGKRIMKDYGLKLIGGDKQ